MSSSRAPRVALVHDWLTGMRGGENVLAEIAALHPGAPIYTLFHFPGSVSPDIEKHPIRTSFLQRAPLLRRHYRSFLPLFPAAIESLDLTGYDLVISSSHCVAKSVVVAPDAYHLCYCHTPMRYAWDQEHAYFPRRRGLTARLRSMALSALRAWDAASAPRVDRFVANSRFVASRIRRYYGRSAAVVHPPVDTEFFTPETGRRRAYAVMIAALAPYKRVDVAIEACRRKGLELRIVGDGPERKRLQRRAGEGVRFLGHVDREELRALYRKAACFVQPGVEDFGIAAVEALACGCPVVARGRGGIRDIVDDGVHGVFYEGPDEAEQLAAAIDKFRELRFNLNVLRERAETFSTARFRQQLETELGSRGSDRERSRS